MADHPVATAYVFWLLGQAWFRRKWPEQYRHARAIVLEALQAEVEAENFVVPKDLI